MRADPIRSARRGILARLESDTFAHAVLLTGARGIGKEDMALWIARAGVCEEDKGERPCGTCAACRSFLSESDLDRIRFYESVEYRPSRVEVELAGGEAVAAQAFATTERAFHDEAPWSFEDWRVRDKARSLREAELWMALYGHVSVEEADRRWDAALAAGQTIEDMVREVRAAAEQAVR